MKFPLNTIAYTFSFYWVVNRFLKKTVKQIIRGKPRDTLEPWSVGEEVTGGSAELS